MSKRRRFEPILQWVRQEICEGRFASGDRLPSERELAERFDASRFTIREVYRKLEDLGLLTIRVGRAGGAFVVPADHNPVRRALSLMAGLSQISPAELAEARLMIEPLIASLAAERADDSDLQRLQAQLTREADSLECATADFRPIHSQFHRIVAECARNMPLAGLVKTLADHAGAAALTLDLGTRMQQQRENWLFHQQLFEAIQRRDPEAASAVMSQHLTASHSRMRPTASRTPSERSKGYWL